MAKTFEPPQHGRQEIGEILGKQPGTKLRGRCAVHPDTRRGCRIGSHALREQAENESAEHITGTCGRQARRGIGVDDGAAIGRRDDGIRPLEDQDRTALPRGGAGP